MSNNNNRPYQQQPPHPYYPQNYQGQPQKHQQPQYYPQQYQQYPYPQHYPPMHQNQQQWGYYPYHMPPQQQHYPYAFPAPGQEKRPTQTPKKQSLSRSEVHKNETLRKQTPRRETPRKNMGSDDQQNVRYSDISSMSSEYESEQEVEAYYKKRPIAKKKDPVVDNKEEIRKWIQARKRNFPRRNKEEDAQKDKVKTSQEEMSILEKKIRKKLILINSDPRSIIKKQKDLDILRRFILHPRRPRKNNFAYEKPDFREGRPLVEEIEPKQPAIEQFQMQQINEEAKPQINLPPQKQQMEQEANKEKQEGQEAGLIQQAIQIPIDAGSNKIEREKEVRQDNRQMGSRGRKEELSVDVIIKHLQMKQNEDSQLLQNFMDYKSNSFHYRYQYQTLQTNLLLENIFRDTSYMLQAIRYIVKNNFFE